MKWYQFHLSTALIVTLTAGALLGLNMTPQPPPQLPVARRDCYSVVGHTYGWPRTWHDATVIRTEYKNVNSIPWLG